MLSRRPRGTFEGIGVLPNGCPVRNTYTRPERKNIRPGSTGRTREFPSKPFSVIVALKETYNLHQYQFEFEKQHDLC